MFEKHGGKFVNVDTTTLDGLSKAKRLNITSSGMVDAIVVSYIYEASELFLPGHRGKFFTMIRDPIERHLSLKGYLGDASWEEKTYDPAFANMTMEEFAYDRRVKSNWYVFILTFLLRFLVPSAKHAFLLFISGIKG